MRYIAVAFMAAALTVLSLYVWENQRQIALLQDHVGALDWQTGENRMRLDHHLPLAPPDDDNWFERNAPE